MSKLLSSWKEIAQYLGKGVRTVQRWEHLGLPVHRPKEGPHVIIAYTHEIDAWVAGGQPVEAADLQAKVCELKAENQRLKAQLDALKARSVDTYGVHELLYRSHTLLSRSALIRQALAETLEISRKIRRDPAHESGSNPANDAEDLRLRQN